MNKCSKCQTEYEGDKCPICSGKTEDSSVVNMSSQENTAQKVETNVTAVNTGANASSTSFMGKIRDFARDFTNKFYSKIKLAPTLSYLLFMVLLALGVCLFPYAKVKAFGVNESYGTILNRKGMEEFWHLKNLALVIIVFAVISLIWTLLLCEFKFGKVLRYSKFFKIPTSLFMEIGSIVITFVDFIFACIVAGKVNLADEGLGIIKVGAYSIVTIIFGILCIIVAILALILCRMHEKEHPELKDQWELDGKVAKENKKAKKANSKFKNSKFDLVRKIVGTAIALPIMIFACISIMPASMIERSIDAKGLKQFIMDNYENWGKDEEYSPSLFSSFSPNTFKGKLEKKFGEADESENGSYVYYTDTYRYFQKRLDRNGEFSELALLSGDERFEDLFVQSANLEVEKETLKYAIAEIDASGVIYCSYPEAKEKKVIATQVLSVTEVSGGSSSGYHLEVEYIATYNDGSFEYQVSKYVYFEDSEGTSVRNYATKGTPVGKKITWTGRMGGTCEATLSSSMIKSN